MGFIALRTIDVAGNKRVVGDLVPEAASWSNLDAYVLAGHVALVPDGKEDEVREMFKKGIKPGLALMPSTSIHHIMNAVRTASMGSPATVPPFSPLAEPVVVDPVEDDDSYSDDELLTMSRTKLNKIAINEFGISNAKKLKDKEAVVEAIMGA